MNYTPKQLEILRLIQKNQKEKGYSPTYSEIASVMDVSPVTIFEHIAALEKKGAVKRRKYEARSIEIIDRDFDKKYSSEMTNRKLVDMIAPKHGRTSCSDHDSGGNEHFNEYGAPRCTRCALLYLIQMGSFPHNVTVKSSSITFTGHPRITE